MQLHNISSFELFSENKTQNVNDIKHTKNFNKNIEIKVLKRIKYGENDENQINVCMYNVCMYTIRTKYMLKGFGMTIGILAVYQLV